MARIALAGDTMLGRRVAERVEHEPVRSLFGPDLLEVLAEADHVLLNLECCISARGERWPDPAKPFFFRAPPRAVDALHLLGVDCVTLANNHALDYGERALLDTLDHLARGGIAWVGAGTSDAAAWAPAVLDVDGAALAVVGFTDHPAAFAAGPDRPGVAYADLTRGLPARVEELVAGLAARAEGVLVTPHWGPNMVASPVPRVLAAASALTRAGATLVAGHSAHVAHGVAGRVLYDLGDFIDDYAVDPSLRNDVGLLWLVELDAGRPRRGEVVPLALDYCHTRLADPDERAWMQRRFRRACRELGTEVAVHGDRMSFALPG